MNWARKLVLAVGICLTALTVAVLTTPAVADAIPVGDLVDRLGGDYVFVAVFGALAVCILLAALAWRGVDGLNQTTPPTPEDVQSVPRFGADFDDAVDGRLSLRERFTSDRPERLRQRLREAAVAAEMAATGCSRAKAQRRVADGTWTPDAEAAAFLSDGSGPTPPVAARVRAVLRGRAWYQRGARSAADAVAERAGVVGS